LSVYPCYSVFEGYITHVTAVTAGHGAAETTGYIGELENANFVPELVVKTMV
jgi:hypothetical protein